MMRTTLTAAPAPPLNLHVLQRTHLNPRRAVIAIHSMTNMLQSRTSSSGVTVPSWTLRKSHRGESAKKRSTRMRDPASPSTSACSPRRRKLFLTLNPRGTCTLSARPKMVATSVCRKQPPSQPGMHHSNLVLTPSNTHWSPVSTKISPQLSAKSRKTTQIYSGRSWRRRRRRLVGPRVSKLYHQPSCLEESNQKVKVPIFHSIFER